MSEQQPSKQPPRIIKGTGYPVSLDSKPPIAAVKPSAPKSAPKPAPKSSK